MVGQVLPTNLAATVRGPTHEVRQGKTPVLKPEETRQLLESINVDKIAGLWDRTIIGAMVFSFTRMSAVLNMNVNDYFTKGRRG